MGLRRSTSGPLLALHCNRIHMSTTVMASSTMDTAQEDSPARRRIACSSRSHFLCRLQDYTKTKVPFAMNCFSILLGALLAVSRSNTLTTNTPSGAGSPLRRRKLPSVEHSAGVLLEVHRNPRGNSYRSSLILILEDARPIPLRCNWIVFSLLLISGP